MRSECSACVNVILRLAVLTELQIVTSTRTHRATKLILQKCTQCNKTLSIIQQLLL